jgi:hypothetical protein
MSQPWRHAHSGVGIVFIRHPDICMPKSSASGMDPMDRADLRTILFAEDMQRLVTFHPVLVQPFRQAIK